MANIILEGFERILVIGNSSSLVNTLLFYLSYGGGPLSWAFLSFTIINF